MRRVDAGAKLLQPQIVRAVDALQDQRIGSGLGMAEFEQHAASLFGNRPLLFSEGLRLSAGDDGLTRKIVEATFQLLFDSRIGALECFGSQNGLPLNEGTVEKIH